MSPSSHPDPVELALTGARRVAMVGASDDPTRPSHGVMSALLGAGLEVVPVNPTVAAVSGRQAYPDLTSVPGRIDVVDVFRAAEHLAVVAREAVARDDVAVVWNQLGLVSDEARSIVAAAGRAYVEDHCMAVEVGRRDVLPSGPRLEHPVLLVDLDGTVLDYRTAEARAFTGTLTALGIDSDEEAVATYRRINAAHWAAFERDELSADELRSSRWEAFLAERGVAEDGGAVAAGYLDRLGAAGDLLPRAREALWWLGRRATPVALTNGFEDVQRRRLDAAALTEAFVAMVSSEAAGVAKPDPAVLDVALAAAGMAGVDPDDVAIVGDSLPSDIAVAEAAGITAVWVAPPDAALPADGPQPDHVVAALADVA